MKENLSSYLRRKFGSDGVNQAEEEEAQAIHEIAREFFSADFQNPERIGCPPKESFIKLMSENSLPSRELQDHLLSCSECFNEYRAELRISQAATAAKKNVFPFQIRLALAGGLIAVLIAVAGGFLWFRQTNTPQTARNESFNADAKVSTNAAGAGNAETDLKTTIENQMQVGAENNTNSKRQINPTNNGKTEQKRTTKEPEPPLIARNEVEIDLTNPIWRDSSPGDSNQKAVRLEAKKTRLRVRLPKDNPTGAYQVFLVDEFAKPLTEKKTVQTGNGSLFVEFDLSRIGGNQKRLCFAPVGEIPDCVLVNIVQPK